MFIEVNGVKLFYEKMGEGSPVILIHGNGEDHSIWITLMQSLSKSHAVYAVDSRDHGQSSKVHDLHYSDMANDIAEFTKTLNLEKPSVIGFSDGGIIALLLGINYPLMFSHLVVCGANTNPKGMKRKPLFFIKLGYLFSRNNKFKLMISEPDITDEDLSKITVPTLVLAGSNDIIIEEHTINIARNIKNSELRILENESHSSYIVGSNKLFSFVKTFWGEK